MRRQVFAFWKILVDEVFSEIPQRPIPQIIQIVFPVIRFFFEAYIVVSLLVFLAFESQNQILRQVPDVKRQNQHFQLLPQMNLFVVEQPFVVCIVLVLNEHKGKQRHAMHPQKRNVYENQCLTG